MPSAVPQNDYVEAAVTAVDLKEKKVSCRYTKPFVGAQVCSNLAREFEIPYDVLIVAVSPSPHLLSRCTVPQGACQWKAVLGTKKNAGRCERSHELQIGAVTNTFNVPGVEENCFFLKKMEHAKRLRQRINECFEIASLPNTTPEERKQLLSFVIVSCRFPRAAVIAVT